LYHRQSVDRLCVSFARPADQSGMKSYSSVGIFTRYTETARCTEAARRENMNRLGKVGTVIITLFFLVAIFAPVIAPHSPTEKKQFARDQALEERLKPTRVNPFGMDDLGRDVMSRVIFGARISMQVGVAVVLISAFIGMIIGAVSGYYGGWMDRLFSG